MEYLKNLITILTAISLFMGFMASINKFTKGKIFKWLQKPVLDKLKEHDKRLSDLELNDLKQIIMNEKIPLSERVSAGERYILLGGNGAIHTQVEVLKEQYKKELEKEK